MSAVSKKFTPASRAASTTASVPRASMRFPKLLQPTPTTDTSSAPMRLVFIVIHLTCVPATTVFLCKTPARGTQWTHHVATRIAEKLLHAYGFRDTPND